MWRLASAGSRHTSTPSTTTVPASGRSSPVTMLRVVVLPAPFGPTRPKKQPCGTSRLSQSTAILGPYALRRPRRESAGALFMPDTSIEGQAYPSRHPSVAGKLPLPLLAGQGHHGRMRSTRALVALVVVGGALLLGLGQAAGAATASAAPDPAHTVRVLKLDGAVDPFMASYLTRNIHAADDAHDAAVLIEIDTPGGLDSSMRTITKAILNSPVPVLCWTGPSGGARAASAGTFIMLACPWNAMAPGTEIGAAHPVGVAGAIEDAKVTADAVGFIQSLARQWGRDPAWAKSAVTLKGEQASISAQDAVNNKPPVADFPASSPQEFLNDVDGRTTGPNGEGGQARPVAHVAGADLVTEQMGLGVGLLHALIDPSLVFLFFYAGIILIVIELLHPGVSVPGVVGTLLLVVSIVSLGMLPVQLGGVILLVASAVLYLLELKHPGIGLPAIGGTACLVLGGLLLFDPSVPNAHVSRWLLLVGAQGMALDALDPRGQVWVGHEDWTADSVAGPIPAGTPVRVVGRSGLKLLVEPAATIPASGGPDASGDPAAR